MSYQVLARKWRPKSFSTLVGQDHVVQALSNALNQQRLHHAYLFTGTRGVGKTTLSRILAKSLNCAEGISANPCGKCDACTAIDIGRYVDYIEMDAASNRGIADMVQLLEQAIYAPAAGRFKVYMIDEVHMLTKEAFNAMLKTLEEPPAHIKFILATTDPQKVPVTILSRCLQFNLRQMASTTITAHLQSILQQEQIPFEPAALHMIARAAAGSMRDALSLTDQAIAYGNQSVKEQEVRGMLGAIDQSYLFDILRALVAHNSVDLLRVAQTMDERSIGFEAALADLASLLHQISIAQQSPDSLPADMPDREQLLQLATALTAETLQLYYQICILGRRDIGLAPDEYAGFSMTLLRMLAFKPETSLAQTKPSSATSHAQATGAPPSAKAALQNNVANTVESASTVESDGAIKKSDAPASADNAPMPSSATLNATPHEAPTQNTAAFDGNWRHLVENVLKLGLARGLALNCELIKFEHDCFYVRIADSQKHLASANYKDKLISALTAHFGRRISMQIETGQEVNTPAKQNAIEKAEMQSSAEQAIMQDAFVQALIQDMGATIIPNSIKPLQ